MKIRLFAKTLLAVLLCSSFAVAHEGDADRQISRERRMAFSVDPLIWTAGNLSFQYEVSLNDRLSLNLPFKIGFNKAVFNNTYAGTYFAPKVGVKYYVTGKATHQGFYVNPLLGLFVGKLDAVNGVQADSNAGLTYGFRFGYAWNIWHGFWMDSYFGYETMACSFNSDSNSNSNGAKTRSDLPLDNNGFSTKNSGFNAGMMIGYNW
ncbi:MAG: DUF3575 domain-containing protein [Myxococcaceae bacterium]